MARSYSIDVVTFDILSSVEQGDIFHLRGHEYIAHVFPVLSNPGELAVVIDAGRRNPAMPSGYECADVHEYCDY